MNNVMFDLETYGKRPGCVIRSIGAVVFDPYSMQTGEKFYMNVDRKSCEDVGLIVDPSTEAWWNTPKNRLAQLSLEKNQQPIIDVAMAFQDYFRSNRGIFLWSQGSNFDEPIWNAVLDALGIKQCWEYHASRDTRTAYGIAGLNVFKIRRTGTHHNALADAEHQAMCVQKAFKLLGKHEELV